MINKLIDIAKKNNIALEIYKEREKSTSIKVFDDKIDSFDSFDTTSYKLKAIYEGKTINIETENIEDTDKLINLIKEEASIIDNNDKNKLANNNEKIQCELVNNELDFFQIANDMLEFNNLKKEYPNLKSIETSFGYSEIEIGIYNTLNTQLEDSNSYLYCLSEIVMDFDGNTKTDYKYYYSKNYDKKDFSQMIKKLIDDTINKRNETSVNSNKYNILLDNRCVANLLIHFSSIYSAEMINKNKSILSDKFNQKVFSNKITIVEDPNNNQYIGKRLFDDEGTKTCFKEIIKNGVFITKLYNNKTAIKDNTKSTGNSFGVRNMYIVPGKSNKEELLKQLQTGIYITSIEGLHAGINDTTGDISLQAEGYMVENGIKKQALNMIVLSSNIFELFNNVSDIGNDLEMISPSGGAPSLLITNITIAGNK